MSPKLLPILLCPLLLLAPTVAASGVAVADPAGDQASQLVDRRAPDVVTCQAPRLDVVTFHASSDGSAVAAGFDASDPLAGASCGGQGVYSQSDLASYRLLVHDRAHGVESVYVRVLTDLGGLTTCTTVQFHDVGKTSCTSGGSLGSVLVPLKGTVLTSLGPRTFDLEGSPVSVTLVTFTRGWFVPGVEYTVSDFAATPTFTA